MLSYSLLRKEELLANFVSRQQQKHKNYPSCKELKVKFELCASLSLQSKHFQSCNSRMLFKDSL